MSEQKPIKKVIFHGLSALASFFGDGTESDSEKPVQNVPKKCRCRDSDDPQHLTKMPKLLPIYQNGMSFISIFLHQF
jgi:hypothetical protein